MIDASTLQQPERVCAATWRRPLAASRERCVFSFVLKVGGQLVSF